MGSVKDIYDISVNVLKLIKNLLETGVQKREVESVLRKTLEKGQIPDNLTEIIDGAKKSLSPKNSTLQALERINKDVKSKVSSKKPAAKKVAKKPASKKVARKSATCRVLK